MRCGYVSSQDVCKACLLLEGLNKGLPKLGIGKSHKVRRVSTVIHTKFNTYPPNVMIEMYSILGSYLISCTAFVFVMSYCNCLNIIL